MITRDLLSMLLALCTALVCSPHVWPLLGPLVLVVMPKLRILSPWAPVIMQLMMFFCLMSAGGALDSAIARWRLSREDPDSCYPTGPWRL